MHLLNSGKGYVLFEYEAQKDSYVDKSMLIDTVFNYARRTNKYICITRPRRFGKSTAANMIASFFEETHVGESRRLFEGMKIGIRSEHGSCDQPSLWSCWDLQGKCKVIRINMLEILAEKIETYQDFERILEKQLIEDLAAVYPDMNVSGLSIPVALEKTGDQFVFVIDEWDAIFEEKYISLEDREAYLQYLKGLLKDRSYVRFVYMTGVLPIAKYSSGSPLNMFKEFTAFADAIFYPFFGLTEQEIRELMARRGYTAPTMEELSFWYDGYIRDRDGVHIYNPTSVSEALAEGICQSHWTGTGPMNEVRDLIQHNVQDLREDVIRMAGGETLEIKLSGFAAEKNRVSTRDEILSAMVVYGFLTYHAKQLRIPNHELMLKFQEALAHQSMGLRQTLKDSETLLRATLNREDEKVAQLMEELHDEKIPFFHYSDENSLACVVTMGYLAALDDYRITREEKAGKGFVDFCFTPMKKGTVPIILELKYNHSARNAIQCIHERGYVNRFRDEPRVLLVGINYSDATKKHTCRTEMYHPR